MDWGNVTAEDLIGALKEIDWTSPPRPLNEFLSKFTIPRSYSKWSSRLKCNLYYYRTNYFILILLILGVACILRPLAILATALSALAIAFFNDRIFTLLGDIGKDLKEPSYATSAAWGRGEQSRMITMEKIVCFRVVEVVNDDYKGENRSPNKLSGIMCLKLAVVFSFSVFAASFGEKVTRTVRKFSPHLAAKMRPPHMPVIRGRPSAKKSVYICGQPRLLFVLLFSAASFLLWYSSGSLLYVSWAYAISIFVTVLHASFRTPNLKARLNTFREEFRAVWRNYSEL
ncbi:hypothetical protein POTOM_038632 [Populus tomentosa]|uniref:PRA1 family protein n=1 Tax=Populus tomentosa TaxID=118781 RepID=A0A8X7YZ06_POPTO|nr:hypothetical protein POTOM_038632 [Populus tomentosa]